MKIEKPQPRAPIVTIFGDASTGKNSLATAMAKNPLVLRCEDGVHRQTKKLDMPDALPPCRNVDDVFAQLLWLLQEDHGYDSLIFDSASAADAMFTADVVEKGGKNGKPAASLATAYGGYGAGYGAVAAMHGRVRKAAGLLNDRKGMMVIFIVHADLETMKLPDVDDYQRYSLKLTSAKNANSIAHYVDNVDLVAHVRLTSALRGGDEERKKVISNGDREIVVHATSASVTKNGLGITEPLDFEEGTNPLAEYMATPAKKRAPKKKAEPQDDAGDADASDVDPADFVGEE
jgi:hypothetical protein|tara:strand:- start:11748 stop:12617 length:870 start_codon:yes stop_codon:yes gene_type:complete